MRYKRLLKKEMTIGYFLNMFCRASGVSTTALRLGLLPVQGGVTL